MAQIAPTSIERMAGMLDDVLARRGRSESTVGAAAAIWSAGYLVVRAGDVESLRERVETGNGCAVCGLPRRSGRPQRHEPGWPCAALFSLLTGQAER